MRAMLVFLLLPVAALAQSDPPPPPDPVEPPPAAAADRVLLDDRDDAPIPEKILQPPPPEAEPAVSIRTDGRTGDVVEEYRMNGRVYMVKVRPEKGIPYTLQDTNGDGRLDAKDGDGPVRPVYYTLYEWN